MKTYTHIQTYRQKPLLLCSIDKLSTSNHFKKSKMFSARTLHEICENAKHKCCDFLIGILCIIPLILPVKTAVFEVIILDIISLINLICLFCLFVYYNQLPCEKQTILVFLVQECMTCRAMYHFH